MNEKIRAALAATAAAFLCPAAAHAQSTTLPPVVVSGTAGPDAGESLTVPTTEAAREALRLVPGGATVVADDAFRNAPSTTVKDVLDYVPGVFAQPKWGEDTRLSIRGSGLSRNFHLRGVQLYMDGIPINTADGYGDFQEVDPSAYRYVEVYKGANALRFGGNALGGAINFVTPSGRDAPTLAAAADAGSFGFRRLQAGSGGAAGPLDWFVTGAWQEADGFRDHSDGHSRRASVNLGYRITGDVETRFYLNTNDVFQRIPGGVTREVALEAPETAAANNLAGDWQRNLDTHRFANRTTVRLGATTLELGAFGIDRRLEHPIFQWLDYRYNDHGGFVRVLDERTLAGHANRLVLGVQVHNGKVDNEQFANVAGEKGALLSSSLDRSENTTLYGEDIFNLTPRVALVVGAQVLIAERDRKDRFLANGDQSGRTEHELFSPRIGLLWDVAPDWQAFANLSRSAEVPSFGEGTAAVPFTDIEPQRATTVEIGTRGTAAGYTWDASVYRAEIDNELQCLFSAFGNCNVVNADSTVHQGIELGGSAVLLRDLGLAGTAGDDLWLRGAYTLNDFFFDDDPVFGDNELPGAPRHLLRAELLYRHPAGFHVGPDVGWVPEAYWGDSANTLETEPYGLLGLRAGWDDGGAVALYVEGRNLTDEQYIASASIIDRANAALPLFEPGTGRAAFAGVRLRW